MERVKKYVQEIIYKKITENGYLYLSDNILFVQEKISTSLKELNLDDVTVLNRIERLEQLNLILNSNAYIDKIPFNLRVLIEYQQFLDEKKYGKQQRRKILELLSSQLKGNYLIRVFREKYAFDPSRITLDFIDDINDIISKIKELSVNKLDVFYRGHANMTWELIPSIYRNSWIQNEHNMFREILIRNPMEFTQTKSAFEKLTIMQHYGLPTRLLDITKNPLVALYFACSDKSQLNMPGEIFIFTPTPDIIKFYDSDTVSILSNLSKAERNLKTNKKKDDFNANYYEGTKFLHLIKEEKPYFLAEINPMDFSKTLIVKPINNNERIKRQLGYFILFGIKSSINNPSDISFTYKINKRILKLFIEETKKEYILNELEAVGISSDTLFPEIDNGTDYIKSKY